MEGVQTRITRKIRQGVIEIDFDAPALVIHFVIEVVWKYNLILVMPSVSNELCEG